MVHRLEEAFARKYRVKHAIALCNGTATLHSILMAGTQGKSKVMVPALTMASTALAVLHAGLEPEWVDVSADTWVVTHAGIQRGMRVYPRAIITVALYGLRPEMTGIRKLATDNHLLLIEDNAQCFGGYEMVGDAASFSFQSSKHLTCGEGGIIITNDDALATAIREVSCLGYRSGFTKEQIQSPAYERHHRLGWNYRMSDLQAAVALAQVERMDELVDKRRKCAKDFFEAFDGEILKGQGGGYNPDHAYWSAAATLDTKRISWQEFRALFLANGGDPFYACWRPAYQEPVFDGYSANCPIADRLQPTIVALKTNYYGGESKQQAEILKKTILQASRGARS